MTVTAAFATRLGRGLTLWAVCALAVAGLLLYPLAPEVDERACPLCGPGPHVAPWSYGYPDFKGGVVPQSPGPHGGCGISDKSPKWHCYRCGRDWGRYMTDR